MTNRIAIITGASSGIGAACTSRLVAAGWRVHGVQRSMPANPIAGANYHQLDVCDAEAARALVEKIAATEGRIDALVNNAGYALMGPIEISDPTAVRAQLETNVMGVLNMCRAVIPPMRAAGHGHIVNIGSLAGLLGLPFSGIYSASKFAVEGLSESLRHELRPFGIKVCLIEPGDIDTSLPANRRYTPETPASSHYAAALAKVAAAQAADEAKAPPPDLVARKLERLLNAKSPMLRHVVGAPGQTIVVPLKRFLPQRAFELVLRQALGI